MEVDVIRELISLDREAQKRVEQAHEMKVNLIKKIAEDENKISKEDSILTTYAISTNIRLSMYEAGFYIYEIRPTKRKITLAFKNKEEKIGKYIDMELKKIRNKDAKSLKDSL